MTLQDLKDRIASVLHRSDLTNSIPNWIADATERINRRFGIALVSPAADTDPLPAPDLLYLYASLASGYEHLNNGDNARYYAERWELEADREVVLNPGGATDNYAAEPPAIIGA